MTCPSIISRIKEASPGAFRQVGLAVAAAAGSVLLAPVPFLLAWQLLGAAWSGTVPKFTEDVSLALSLGAVLAGAVLKVVAVILAHRAGSGISSALVRQVMAHIGALPLHWFSGRPSGELADSIRNNAGDIDSFVAHSVTDMACSIFLPLVITAWLFHIDWRLAWLLPLLAGFALFLQVDAAKRAEKDGLVKKYADSLSLLNADAVEFVQGMPDIKIYNRAVDSFSRINAAIAGFRDIQTVTRGFFAKRWAAMVTVAVAPLSVLGIGGASLVLYGGMPLESFVLFLGLGMYALSPLPRILMFASSLAQAVQSAGRLEEILAIPREERGNALAAEVETAEVRLENVSVVHGEEPVLRSVGFTAEAGKVTAIVGPSGSGKSTVAAVITGMEYIREGRVTIGGYGVSEFSSHELSRLAGVVRQDPFIFAGSVADNIRLGLKADMESVMNAVAVVRGREMIASLPRGYDTRIGQGGEAHLSGGQRQRIALARMVLRDPAVVVLDEATAFADPESEAVIQEGLSSFLTGKTVLVIAHRLHSIAGADKIVVLDHGSVAEEGDHETLLRLDGMYARIWQAYNTSRRWLLRTERMPEKTASALMEADAHA